MSSPTVYDRALPDECNGCVEVVKEHPQLNLSIYTFASRPCRVYGRILQLQPYRLKLGVVLDGVHSKLTSEAGLLVSAKRQCWVHHSVSIDPDGSRLEPLAEGMRFLKVSRPDSS